MREPLPQVTANAREIVRAAGESASRHPVILLDGPSGAGKTSTADVVAELWPEGTLAIVRLDDLYSGWSGLDEAGVYVQQNILEPRARGAEGRWQRYDWHRGERAEWHAVRSDAALLIEGCGVLTRENAALADLRVWIDGAPETRKERALRRDDGAFDDHWEMWSDQVRAFIERENPVSSADLVLAADEVSGREVGPTSGGSAREGA